MRGPQREAKNEVDGAETVLNTKITWLVSDTIYHYSDENYAEVRTGSCLTQDEKSTH